MTVLHHRISRFWVHQDALATRIGERSMQRQTKQTPARRRAPQQIRAAAGGGVQRAGFERMVAQVCLGKVGAVAAREVSRFARNSRDWQQLIEMCRVVDTVLIDQETVYAPRHGNDRLLLGLKGSLNEY